MKKNHRDLYAVLGLVPICSIISGILLLPLITMILDSFCAEDGSGLTLENYITTFSRSFYLIAIKNSIVISLISTLTGLIIALFVSYAITRYTGRVKDNLLMIINMTTNFSGVPLAFAFIILFGYSGIVTIVMHYFNIYAEVGIYTWMGVAMTYIYFQIPLGILLTYPLFEGIKDDWYEAAAMLGADSFIFWLRIGIPYMLPGVLGAFGILFANAMGSYATAYALVGGNYNLLTIRITSLISGDVNLRPQLGSALAVVLGIIIILSVMLNEILVKKMRRTDN